MKSVLISFSILLLAAGPVTSAVAKPAVVKEQTAKVDMAKMLLPPPVPPGKDVQPFVKVPAGKLALAHVRVIDGTGAPPQDDRTVLIDGARIAGIQPGTDAVPADYRVIDATGKTVLPGLVGMHDHIYYIALPNLDSSGDSANPVLVPQMTFSAPRLYLAGGVTTLRTAGSVEPYADLNLKRQIDAGALPGPHMDVTAPYLEGAGSPFIQMGNLTGPEHARRTVAFWAEQGATSFKAYMNITRDELTAAADEAHARGLKITGHLCSVTYPEAIVAGIDNLEHGFMANTQLDPGKQPDTCSEGQSYPTMLAMDPAGPEARALIASLVAHRVAVTSTLPVFETFSPRYRILPQRQLDLMSAEARSDYLVLHNSIQGLEAAPRDRQAKRWANGLALERAFVAAGGLLLAGADPTGAGQVLPGFGDQREVELLVEAGFTPVEAIRIATLNGATYLGVADRIGTVAPGKNADLMLVRGDPSRRIADIEAVDTVFKDGTGYDPAALLASVRGRYGQY